MTLSTLDPVTALVVVDLQGATVRNPTVHPAVDVVRRSARLAAAFRAHGLPVVLASADLNDPPGGRSERGGPRPPLPDELLALVPELDAAAGDLRAPHRGWSAFGGSTLEADLRRVGATQVVIAGLATSFGVESTARDAYDAGFHVTLVVDAMTDLDLGAHQRAVGWIFPVLGETATTDEVLAALGA
ncbi:MAG TPA: isochorismatase family protein [Cellulomonas sp.]